MLTVLTAHEGKLTKTFTRDTHGRVTKSDYDNAVLFSSTVVPVENIFDLSEVLTELEGWSSSCVVRARLRAGEDPERHNRRKMEDPAKNAPSMEKNPNGVPWLLCDFDKVPAPERCDTHQARLDYLVSMLPTAFHDVTYHYQWSSSQGRDGWDTLSCHLWFWLDKPHDDDLLCQRHQVEQWDGADEAAFRTVQPLYTANPQFIGMEDFLGEVPRSCLIRAGRDEVSLTTFVPPPPPTFPCGAPMPFVSSPSFKDRLKAIGPRLHQPILQAAASYAARYGHATNSAELVAILEERIADCGPCHSDKRAYLTRSYLNRVVDTAIRKFGNQQPTKAARLELSFSTLKRN